MIPCNNCEDREIGCHSKCTKYIKFKSLKDAEREARLKDRVALTYSFYKRSTPTIFKDSNKAKTKATLYNM